MADTLLTRVAPVIKNIKRLCRMSTNLWQWSHT